MTILLVKSYSEFVPTYLSGTTIDHSKLGASLSLDHISKQLFCDAKSPPKPLRILHALQKKTVLVSQKKTFTARD